MIMVRVCLFTASALMAESQTHSFALPPTTHLYNRDTTNVTVDAMPTLVAPPCVDPYRRLHGYSSMDSGCYAPCDHDDDCGGGEGCDSKTSGCYKLCNNKDSDCDFKGSEDWQPICILEGAFTGICSFLDMGKCKSHTEQESADLCNAKCESLQCSNQFCVDMSGDWVQVSGSSGKQTLTFEHGVTKSYTVSDSFAWGKSVTNSVKAGFRFGPLGAGKVVTGMVSASLGSSYSSTFVKTETTEFQYQFDKGGVVWQWQWTSMEPCGSSFTKGQDVVLTDGAWAPPCCLPGWFKDITNPHGECHAALDGSVYTLCPNVPTTTMPSARTSTTTIAGTTIVQEQFV